MGQSDTGEQHPAEMNADVLQRHDLRPQWGRALLAWEREDKRGYQFEDGQLRVFKFGYFHLFIEDDSPAEEAAEVAAALRRSHGMQEQPTEKPLARSLRTISVERQVQLFERLYPKGFRGTKWAREKRGVDTLRRLQRHRDLAIIEAQRLLSESRLKALCEAGKHAAVVKSMREVCDGTSLVAKAQLRQLDNVDEVGSQKLAERLLDLLHGDSPFGIRFERFVDTLARTTGQRPTWQLVTVFLALVHPKEHCCIAPGAMRKQVAFAGRRIKVPTVPNAPIYEHLLGVVDAIRSQLVQAGRTPRDLIDVYDFIDTTTKPKALKLMEPESEQAAA